MRKETKDTRFKAPLDLVQKPILWGRLRETFAKPFTIFVREPMLIAVAFYIAVSAYVVYRRGSSIHLFP